MRQIQRLAVAVAALACAAPLAASPAFALTRAPAPSKPVDLARYAGRWYEVARLHNRPEDGCASATIDYLQGAGGRVTAVETCRRAAGPPKVWRPRVAVLDPGENAKLKLTFFPFVSLDYWVLDHADDYAWAVVGTANGKYLWLFSRQASPPAAETADMVKRAQELGYDTSRLIYDK